MDNNYFEFTSNQEISINDAEMVSEEPILIKPPAHYSKSEKWIFYKVIEKKLKDEMDKITKGAKEEVIENDKFYQNKFGKVNYIESETKKPKDSMKDFLNEKGYLEMCLKDEVDLKKAQALVDAGLITKSDLDKHTKSVFKRYLKFMSKE